MTLDLPLDNTLLVLRSTINIQNPDVSPKVYDEIHNVIRMSKLDFRIQQSPYRSYITIRRKVQKNITNEALYATKVNKEEMVNLNLTDKVKSSFSSRKYQ